MTDEKEIINKILKGDTSAFGYFVDAYQDMAINIAYRICENKQDAEDIVQNSFVKAFHNLHAFKNNSKFSTWFYRIVCNTALNQISSLKLDKYVDYEFVRDANIYSESDILQEIDTNEKKAIIDEAMHKLPKDECLILTLYYLEDTPVKEISIITSLTESNVKIKLHRARKRLLTILSKSLKNE